MASNFDITGTYREVVGIFYIGVNPSSEEFVAPIRLVACEPGHRTVLDTGRIRVSLDVAANTFGRMVFRNYPRYCGIYKKGGRIT